MENCMKYLHPVTPVLSEDVIGFCESISEVEPFLVDVKPVKGAEINECWVEVPKYVAENGGEMVLGWSIGEMPELFIEAQFHAVWKYNDTYLDITPKEIKTTRVLFLPDDSLTLTGKQLDNIRHSYRRNEYVADFFEAHQIRFEFLNRGERANQFGDLQLSDSEWDEFGMIMRAIEATSLRVSKYFPDYSPYLSCPCGCGKKSKWCDFK